MGYWVEGLMTTSFQKRASKGYSKPSGVPAVSKVTLAIDSPHTRFAGQFVAFG